MTFLAIVGSRDLDGNAMAWQTLEAVLDELKPSLLISGGAGGIDSMAEESAKARGIPTCIFLPEKPLGWPSYRARDLLIAEGCDMCVRIYSNTTKTYGSGWTVDQAEKMGKQVRRILIDNE